MDLSVRGDQAPVHRFDAVALASRRSPDRLRPGVIASTRSPRRDQAELSKRIPFSNFAIRVPTARPDLRITPPNTNELKIAKRAAGDVHAQEGVHAARAREAVGPSHVPFVSGALLGHQQVRGAGSNQGRGVGHAAGLGRRKALGGARFQFGMT